MEDLQAELDAANETIEELQSDLDNANDEISVLQEEIDSFEDRYDEGRDDGYAEAIADATRAVEDLS